jgi:uncharacterized membrane protein YkoI
MHKHARWLIGGALALGLVGAGVGIGLAESNGDSGTEVESTDSDHPLTGADLDQARAAALEFTGGGTVTEAEAGDDGAAYGVEVRKDDGTQVEVRLDETFAVIGSEVDDE